MNKYLSILLTLTLISCDNPKTQEQHQASLESSEVKSSDKKAERCTIEGFLNDPNILSEAKEIWNDTRQPIDDEATSNILNKLTQASESELPFYILVVNKINGMADGALTEMTMSAAFEFVNGKTELFFDLYNNSHCLLKQQNLTSLNSFADNTGTISVSTVIYRQMKNTINVWTTNWRN